MPGSRGGQAVTTAPKQVTYEDGLRLVQTLVGDGRLPMAVRWADRLCRHRPDDARAHNQAGLVRQRLGRPDAAVLRFRRAVLLQPDAAELWVNLGNALRHVAAFDEALLSRFRGVLCRPDESDMRLSYALGLLAAGDYRRGFAEYEHRENRSKGLARYAEAGWPLWDGRIRPGGRILLATEQGAGDAVQFVRFVRPLAERGMEVVIACPPGLQRLLRSAPGVAAVTGPDPSGSPAAFGGVDMLLSLPARLGLEDDVLRLAGRYIEPPEPAFRVPAVEGLRVGLCWTGNVATPLNEMRRIVFGELARLLDTPGAVFYGLQVAAGSGASAGEPRLLDLSPHIEDFADTAAMIDQMDLVITVDTSVAHMAGALGKPVWTLLARVADWRWGHDGETSAWYPSMRLFRQSRAGDWSDVVARVADELRRVAGFRLRR